MKILSLSLLMFATQGIAQQLDSVLDSTVSKYACKCQSKWSCTSDETVHGTVTSMKVHESVSLVVAKSECHNDMMDQIFKYCLIVEGRIHYSDTFDCTESSTSN